MSDVSAFSVLCDVSAFSVLCDVSAFSVEDSSVSASEKMVSDRLLE